MKITSPQQEIMIKEYNIHAQSQQKKTGNIPNSLPELIQTVQLIRPNTCYKQVFNVILLLHNRYRNIIHYYAWIAKEAKCSKRSVIRALKFFREHGWLWTDQRYNDSLIYYINPIFKQYEIRQWLKSSFRALSFFMLCDLFVSVDAAGRALPETVTVLYSSEYIREKKTKKKRLSCIITASALGRAAAGEAGEAISWGRVSAPLGSAASEPPYYDYKKQQPQEQLAINNNATKEQWMRRILATVANAVNLNEEQLAQLDTFSDAAIEHALNRLKKSKNVKDAAAFFMHVLRSDAGLEHLKQSKWQQPASSPVRPNQPKWDDGSLIDYAELKSANNTALSTLTLPQKEDVSKVLMAQWNKAEDDVKAVEALLAEAKEQRLPTVPFLEFVLKINRKAAVEILGHLVNVDLNVMEEEDANNR